MAFAHGLSLLLHVISGLEILEVFLKVLMSVYELCTAWIAATDEVSRESHARESCLEA